jgi:hypothetical protein
MILPTLALSCLTKIIRLPIKITSLTENFRHYQMNDKVKLCLLKHTKDQNSLKDQFIVLHTSMLLRDYQLRDLQNSSTSTIWMKTVRYFSWPQLVRNAFGLTLMHPIKCTHSRVVSVLVQLRTLLDGLPLIVALTMNPTVTTEWTLVKAENFSQPATQSETEIQAHTAC